MTRALLFDGNVRITAVSSRNLVERAVRCHGLSAVCAAALGRTMTVSAVLASELKNPTDSLTVTVKGDGPVGKIIVAADGCLRLRGTVGRSDVELPLNAAGKLDVGGAVGCNGNLVVVKDLGLKEPYVGQCALVSGEIGEDFAQYFTESEQQPAAVAVGVLADRPGPRSRQSCRCVAAGGFVIRLLPGCPEEIVSALEEKLSALTGVSDAFRNRTAEEFLREHFSDCDLQILDTRFPVYRCRCSRRRVQAMLHTLSYDDLRKCCAEEGAVEITCQFCNRTYRFGADEIDAMFGKGSGHENG